MNTLHRKDITWDEFDLLARFCYAINKIRGHNGRLHYLLGNIEIWLPVWSIARSGWILSQYKPFKREAIGLETCDFRLICRYLRVKEAFLVNTLFRLSMLAVVPKQSISTPRMHRMEFLGVPIDQEMWAPREFDCVGFIIERRRAEGGFRSKDAPAADGRQV
jgi:hypothetical protein